MDIFDAAEDTVESFVTDLAESNVPTVGMVVAGFDPAADKWDFAKATASWLVPALPLADTVMSAFSQEPNVEGAGGLPILAFALASLRQMLEDCGTDEPDHGADFLDGNRALVGIANELDDLSAPDGWTGKAARTYTRANDRQRDRVAEVARVDDRIHRALAAQAADVVDTREVLGGCIRLLNSAIPYALIAKEIPRFGEIYSLSVQAKHVGAVMPVAVTRYTELTDQVSEHAAAVRAAGRSYDTARDESDSGATEFDDVLAVDVSFMRRLASEQAEVATSIRAVKELTERVEGRVRTTHGAIGDPTSGALADAGSSRAETVDWLGAESDQLSDNLDSGAAAYERTAHQAFQKLQAEMRPSLKEIGYP